MKLEQISYILEIAKQGSIGKAAKKLYMSQPNLSMSIRMLEEELGFKIFDRSNSGVELTAKGMELLQYGEEIEKIVGNAAGGLYDPWAAGRLRRSGEFCGGIRQCTCRYFC